MAFNQVNNNPEVWKLSDKDLTSQEFYTGIQSGKGTGLERISSPLQGIIKDAKVTLKQAVKKKPLKRKPARKNTQSKITKRRKRTTLKQTAKPKKRAAKPKKRGRPKTKGKKKTAKK